MDVIPDSDRESFLVDTNALLDHLSNIIFSKNNAFCIDGKDSTSYSIVIGRNDG